jgi:site-specific recombinase XerD
MLKDVYRAEAAVRRLQSCVLGRHLEEFCAHLRGRGYAAITIQLKIGILGRLACWMETKGLDVCDLGEQRAKDFVAMRSYRIRRRREVLQTVLQLIDHLRSSGALPRPEPTSEDSPDAVVLARYESYLREERALAPGTVEGRMFLVRPFVVESLANGDLSLGALTAGRVRDFLLARTRSIAPRRAQAVAGTLRSFLRFLFLRGETSVDLSRAVPTVRQPRIVCVERHIPPQEAERVLRACDLSSTAGRRDHAILLLLARLGLRASEIVGLELDDLRWREGEIAVRGKGPQRDRLPLPAEVGAAIALYLRKDRPPATCRRVFLRAKAPYRGLARSQCVSVLVGRAFVRAGLHPRGAHTFRHSLATAMLRRGASLAEIAEVLRHRSPATTEIYAKLDFGALRDVALPWPVAGGGR